MSGYIIEGEWGSEFRTITHWGEQSPTLPHQAHILFSTVERHENQSVFVTEEQKEKIHQGKRTITLNEDTEDTVTIIPSSTLRDNDGMMGGYIIQPTTKLFKQTYYDNVPDWMELWESLNEKYDPITWYCEVSAPEGLDPYTITKTDECW